MVLGKGSYAKLDEFSEKFQTAFDPPPFWKFMLQIFMIDMVAYMRGGMMAREYEMHAHDFKR